MKKYILLYFLLFFSTYQYAQDFENVAKHVGAGVVIGGVGGYASHKIFNGQRGWTWAGAIGSSLAAGLAKEVYDESRGGVWQTDDVLYTALGGVISGLALELLIKKDVRRSGGRRKGKNCGCLYVFTSGNLEDNMVFYHEAGSGSITSNIEISYLLQNSL